MMALPLQSLQLQPFSSCSVSHSIRSSRHYVPVASNCITSSCGQGACSSGNSTQQAAHAGLTPCRHQSPMPAADQTQLQPVGQLLGSLPAYSAINQRRRYCWLLCVLHSSSSLHLFSAFAVSSSRRRYMTGAALYSSGALHSHSYYFVHPVSADHWTRCTATPAAANDLPGLCRQSRREASAPAFFRSRLPCRA